MSMLPTERDLPPAAHDAARARVVAAVARPDGPNRRWVPLAAAAAVVMLVAGAAGVVAVARDGDRPATPATAATPTTGVTAPIPTRADLTGRCGVRPEHEFITRYVGDGAVSWLFTDEPKKATLVCTWEDGTTGPMASFANDWFGDGMAPATDGRVHVTQDDMFPGFEDGASVPPEYDQWNRDRHVLVGPVPASVTKVVVDGPDGRETAALGSHWFLHHFDKKGTYTVTAYDAAGDVVDEPVRMTYGEPVGPPRRTTG